MSRPLAECVSFPCGSAPVADLRSGLTRLWSRLEQIVAIDLFGAHGRQAAEGLLTELAARPADARVRGRCRMGGWPSYCAASRSSRAAATAPGAS